MTRFRVLLALLTSSCSPLLSIRKAAALRTFGDPRRTFCRVVSSPSFSQLRALKPRCNTGALAPEEDAVDTRTFRDRRRFFHHALAPVVLLMSTSRSSPAQARGLVQFPCDEPLLNKYHFMRAGTSMLDEEDIWSTNPLFLTNREDALSPSIGQSEVIRASQKLKNPKVAPTVIKHSLAACSMDTAKLVGQEIKLGNDLIRPEYTFLDPRAIGMWDMLSRAETEPAVWALDADEAGPDGLKGRPPANEDGTPHETLADQAVRLRQLLSVLETQYSGDTILVIFSDGTGPALLSAMMAGIPYNRVHELEYAPGEIRLDVTMQSTLDLWKAKQQDGEKYAEILDRGRKTLATLRSADSASIISKQDKKLESERIAIDNAYREKQLREKLAREKAENEKREARQREIARAQRERPAQSTSPAILGVGLLGVAAAVAVFTQSGDESGPADDSTKSSQIPDAGGPADTPLASPMVAGLKTAPVGSGLYEQEKQEVNGDKESYLVAPTLPKPADPFEAAEVAMKEYLDRDDGGSDWLQSLEDIMNDPEDTA